MTLGVSLTRAEFRKPAENTVNRPTAGHTCSLPPLTEVAAPHIYMSWVQVSFFCPDVLGNALVEMFSCDTFTAQIPLKASAYNSLS